MPAAIPPAYATVACNREKGEDGEGEKWREKEKEGWVEEGWREGKGEIWWAERGRWGRVRAGR